MRYIRVLKPIQLTNPRTQLPYKVAGPNGAEDIEPLSFADYLDTYPLNDKRFVSSFKAISAGVRIQNQARAAQVGDYVILDDADWDVLSGAIESPDQVAGTPMTPEIARQYLPFMDAIINASDKAVHMSSEDAG